jgi:histone deacetylase 6
MLLHR